MGGGGRHLLSMAVVDIYYQWLQSASPSPHLVSMPYSPKEAITGSTWTAPRHTKATQHASRLDRPHAQEYHGGAKDPRVPHDAQSHAFWKSSLAGRERMT